MESKTAGLIGPNCCQLHTRYGTGKRRIIWFRTTQCGPGYYIGDVRRLCSEAYNCKSAEKSDKYCSWWNKSIKASTYGTRRWYHYWSIIPLIHVRDWVSYRSKTCHKTKEIKTLIGFLRHSRLTLGRTNFSKCLTEVWHYSRRWNCRSRSRTCQALIRIR